MRIALVSETYPPEINGVALTVESLARHLPALGHEIDLIRPRQRPEEQPSGEHEALVRGIALPMYAGLRFGWCSARRLRARWQQARPDAVYVATEGPLGFNAVRAARSLDIPVATGFHTRFDGYMAHYGMRSLAPIALNMLRRFHAAADMTLVPTPQLQDWLSAQRFAHVRLLKRGVDTALFHPARRDASLRAAWGVGEQDPVLLYVGRIAAEKNLGLAIETFDAARAVAPGARMVWVGDGPALAEWQRARPDVIFAGTQREIPLARHFASADLFVFPSLSETFGNVTIEALASGLPVLAFDYGAARAHVASGIQGRLAACDDPSGFLRAASALARELADEAGARERYQASARHAVSGLSHGAAAAQLVSLFQEQAQDAWRAA